MYLYERKHICGSTTICQIYITGNWVGSRPLYTINRCYSMQKCQNQETSLQITLNIFKEKMHTFFLIYFRTFLTEQFTKIIIEKRKLS